MLRIAAFGRFEQVQYLKKIHEIPTQMNRVPQSILSISYFPEQVPLIQFI